jgi:nicotinamide-nucleotide amidase
MKVEIISIGDELLLGQTVNTNASWIGEQLSLLGATIDFGTVIRDTETDIIDSLNTAFSRVDLIVMTGGLGPTQDDITKQTLCKYFDSELEINQEVLDKIEDFFERRNSPMLDVNIQQAAFPVKAELLFNTLGTAPGMWFEKEGKVLISLPGVPYEMKSILSDVGFNMISNWFEIEAQDYRTILTQGIGESYIAERIALIENEIRKEGLGIAYLPSPGKVRIRISAGKLANSENQIAHFVMHIAKELKGYVYGYDDDRLNEIVLKELSSQNKTLGTVESCTGGSVARDIVQVPGSSSVFQGAIVSYSNEIKIDVVGVEESVLENNGAVSKEVVEQMASKGRSLLKTDYCISTSGIAGPDGGTELKPVGTVWIGIATPNKVISKSFQFGSDRGRNIEITVSTALNLLRCELVGINIEKS